MGYIFLFLSVFLTVYTQLIFKWRMSYCSLDLEGTFLEKAGQLAKIIFDPFIVSGYISAFCVSVLWIFVLKKFPLNYAYSFLVLPFIFVMLGSHFIFGESFSGLQLVGSVLICGGILCVAFGMKIL